MGLENHIKTDLIVGTATFNLLVGLVLGVAHSIDFSQASVETLNDAKFTTALVPLIPLLSFGVSTANYDAASKQDNLMCGFLSSSAFVGAYGVTRGFGYLVNYFL